MVVVDVVAAVVAAECSVCESVGVVGGIPLILSSSELPVDLSASGNSNCFSRS